MNAPRAVENITFTFTKSKRKGGWYLIEQWSNRKGSLEYGPMPEAHLDPLIAEIKARTADQVQRQAADFKEHLRQGMALSSAERAAFDPQQESAWLRKQNPQKRK